MRRYRGLFLLFERACCHISIATSWLYRPRWRRLCHISILTLVGCYGAPIREQLVWPADGMVLEPARGSMLRGEAANAAPDISPSIPFLYRREAQGVAESAQSTGFEAAPDGGLMRRLRALAGEDPEPRDEAAPPP